MGRFRAGSAPRVARFWLIWLMLLLPTLALTAGARVSPYLPGDIAVARALQAADPPGWAAVLRALNAAGGGRVALALIVLVAGVFALCRRIDLLGLFLAASAFRPMSGLLKWLTQRPRPGGALVRVTEHPADASFPSGHVLSAVLFYGTLAVLVEATRLPWPVRRAVQALCAAVVLLMGPARVSTGAHWPSDVLGAYLWGGLILAALLWGARRTGLLRRVRQDAG